VWNAIVEAPNSLLASLQALDLPTKFAAEVRRREPEDDWTYWQIDYQPTGIPYEIATKVRRIYGEQLQHDHRRLRAADFDPMLHEIDRVELVMAVEDAFSISISDLEAERTLGSIDSIVQLVARKLGEAGAERPFSSTQRSLSRLLPPDSPRGGESAIRTSSNEE
jgi:acyl carrier protein